MKAKTEFKVQVKSFRWKNYYLKLRDEDFQLKKEKKKYYYTYSLANAAIFDVSDKDGIKIMVSSALYKLYIKPVNESDKNLILSGMENIVRKKAAETAFSSNYQVYKKEIAKADEKNPNDALLFKLNTFQLLKDEITGKMTKFKKMIQQKLSGNLSGEFFSIHNEINSIIIEMGKQFDKIIVALNKYFLEKNDKNDKNTKEEYSSSSSSDEEGINHIKGKKDKRNSQVDSNINNLNDFNNPDYDFKERIKLDKKIKCPENIIKEMITTLS